MQTESLKRILLTPCRTPDQLHAWVKLFTGLNIPRESVCECHDAPFEYLKRAYFEPAGDLLVWAPRGGGKTRLAALATLLDLLHKPGVAVRILGGSLEQSLRMWEHLVPDIERLAGDLLMKRMTHSRRLRLRGGSTCAVLTQSQRAVRGLRVQKLCCDEVELFDPDVWEAAQLVTRSLNKVQNSQARAASVEERASNPEVAVPVEIAAPVESASPTGLQPSDNVTGASSGCDASTVGTPLPLPPAGEKIRGAIEALSTHHRPFGLMSKLLDMAESQRKLTVIHWCLLDVMQRCEPERECATCPLWNDCRGIAKTRCAGFVPIDDAIALKGRVSEECWQAEMLCRRPSVRGRVFPTFDVRVHVRAELPMEAIALPPNPHLRLSRPAYAPAVSTTLHLAIDFGFANPFVCLWIRSTGTGETARVQVLDEYVQPQQTIDVHLQQMQSKDYGTVSWVACDPAGNGRSDQTSLSNVSLLKRAGYRVRYRASRIVDGLEQIRFALRPAAGDTRLVIHPRCVRLIAALRGYRYPEPGSSLAGSELPLKDGEHDHLVDALRYFFVNNINRNVIVRSY